MKKFLVLMILTAVFLTSCANILNKNFNLLPSGVDGYVTLDGNMRYQFDYSNFTVTVKGNGHVFTKDTKFPGKVNLNNVYVIVFEDVIIGSDGFNLQQYTNLREIQFISSEVNGPLPTTVAGNLSELIFNDCETVSDSILDSNLLSSQSLNIYFHNSDLSSDIAEKFLEKTSDYQKLIHFTTDSISVFSNENLKSGMPYWSYYLDKNYNKKIMFTVKINEGAKAIESHFLDMTSFPHHGFSNIVLPDSLTRIGPMAFAYCSNSSCINNYGFITIPSSVMTIEEDAFMNWGPDYTIYLDWSSSDTTPRNLEGLENCNATIRYNDGVIYEG